MLIRNWFILQFKTSVTIVISVAVYNNCDVSQETNKNNKRKWIKIYQPQLTPTIHFQQRKTVVWVEFRGIGRRNKRRLYLIRPRITLIVDHTFSRTVPLSKRGSLSCWCTWKQTNKQTNATETKQQKVRTKCGHMLKLKKKFGRLKITMRNQTETTPRFKVKFKLIFERLLEIILKEDDEFNGL